MKVFVACLFVFCSFVLHVEANPPEKKPLTVELLLKQISQLEEMEEMRGASLAVSVVDLTSGKKVVQHNADLSLAPASVMKLVTTSSALVLLGKDFRFLTKVMYDSDISSDGVLNGNIYIVGGGDPTFSMEQLQSIDWKSLGIKKVKGRVIADARFFDNRLAQEKWVWEDLGNYYGSGAAGLSLNRNTYYLSFKSGKPNSKTKVLGVEPEVPKLSISNEVLAGELGSGDDAYIFGGPYSYEKVVRGTIPPNRSKFTIKGSVPDPAYWAAWNLTNLLEDKGISVEGEPTTFRLSPEFTPMYKSTVIEEFTSEPLALIAKETNEKSVNLFAEAMLKMIGKQKKGEGKTAKGVEAVRELWEERGIDLSGFYMEDGSGLSRFNAFSANQMVALLSKMKKVKEGDAFFKTLAVSGKSGTFKSLCRGQLADGKIFGKSGTMKRVKCYAGYIKTNNGKQLAFTVMANNYGFEKQKYLVKQLEKLFNTMVTL